MAEGQLIGGRYTIHQLLGQGGMATVYAGEDTRTDQRVAIKLLKPEIIESDPEIVTRFEREGQALARLNHPNIVKVLATVRDNDQNYVIMELVSGGDLRELIDGYRRREEMIPMRRVMEIALDLSDALARAHRLNIIHRDLKPGNVLMAEDGTPRLTDFGVARFSDSTRMTQTGTLVGTLAYLSPEMCAGHEATESADIWAFGVMLYEMLTLQRPFDADNSAAMLNAILNREPEPLATLRPDISPELVNLVESMMVKKPDERINSVRLVGAQLEAILAGRELPTSTPTSGTRPKPATVPDDPTIAYDSSQTREMLASEEPGRGFSPLMIGGALVTVIVVIAAVVVLMGGGGDDADETVDTDADSGGQSAVTMVDPVEAGTHMVLVAALEPLGGEERDVSRFIADDLRRRFEEDVPFSSVRIRQTPDVITSPEQAREIAEANNAAVIIWGNYDNEEIDIRMEIGAVVDYPNLAFPREELEDIANARIRMTNERRESLIASVVAILNMLATANNDSIEVGLNIAILQIAEPQSPEIVGNSAAANWHRDLVYYFEDPQRSLEAVNAAINLNPHPIYYVGRGLASQNTGQFDQVAIDARTAIELGPEGWGMPYLGWAQHEFILENDFDAALELLEQASQYIEGYWWQDTLHGGLLLLEGRYDEARPLLEQALNEDPSINWPHMFAIALAMREGRLLDASNLLKAAAEYNIDSDFATRITQAVYGDNNYNPETTATFEAFGALILRQWTDVIAATQVGLADEESENRFVDLYLLQGLAYCNLGDYEAAEASYTQLLEEVPDFPLANLLRAEVRQKLGDNMGALGDVGTAMNSDQSENFAPLLPIMQSGEVGCTNLVDVDLEALLAESTPEA